MKKHITKIALIHVVIFSTLSFFPLIQATADELSQKNTSFLLLTLPSKLHFTKSCTSTFLQNCLTETACEDVGGYWYNDLCNSSENGTCSSTGLNYCSTATECDNAGGIWHNDICYGTVLSNTGKKWLDRNLGSSRAAQSNDDDEAYGDLYQWGRATDGHEKRTSETTNTQCTTTTPDHGEFITGSGSWTAADTSELWQGVDGTNNPCPSGFRLPTSSELEEERESWDSNNIDGAYSSPLKFTYAGKRESSDGALYGVDSGAFIASSTIGYNRSNTEVPEVLRIYENGAFTRGDYVVGWATGTSVRCIKD